MVVAKETITIDINSNVPKIAFGGDFASNKLSNEILYLRNPKISFNTLYVT